MTEQTERERLEARLAQFLKQEIDGVVRDMAHHVGDQIFEVCKRHGLMMKSEAAATGMLVLAAVQVLRQAVDQCSRAAEEDCRDAVIALFNQCLSEKVAAIAREGE